LSSPLFQHAFLNCSTNPSFSRTLALPVVAAWLGALLLPRGLLSSFRGVYVPACIGIIGPILFLRMPYVISEASHTLLFAIPAPTHTLPLPLPPACRRALISPCL
jgi:hypothetical protein